MAKFSSTGHGVFVAMLFIVMWCQALQVTEAKSYYEQIGPYYQHDTIDGYNASDVVAFAGSDNYTKSGPKMGAITIFDDPITVSPDSNSTMVGRAQGIQVVVSTMIHFTETNIVILLIIAYANFRTTREEYHPFCFITACGTCCGSIDNPLLGLLLFFVCFPCSVRWIVKLLSLEEYNMYVVARTICSTQL